MLNPSALGNGTQRMEGHFMLHIAGFIDFIVLKRYNFAKAWGNR